MDVLLEMRVVELERRIAALEAQSGRIKEEVAATLSAAMSEAVRETSPRALGGDRY